MQTQAGPEGEARGIVVAPDDEVEEKPLKDPLILVHLHLHLETL